MTPTSRRTAQPQPRRPQLKLKRKHHPAVPQAGSPLPEAADETQALQDAESAIGINTFLDPETGEPAEGQSPAFLEIEASRPGEGEAVPPQEDT